MGIGASKESASADASPVTRNKAISDLPLPSLDLISNVRLIDPLKVGPFVQSQDLWRDSPVLFFIIRRLGCAFCRDQALEISRHTELLQNQYGIRIVGVALERIGSEEFSQQFWAGKELWMDEEKAFYKALGNGKINRAGLFDIFRSDVRKNYKIAKEKTKKYNLSGSGMILGGVLLVGRGESGIQYIHRETVFGDKVNIDELLSACKSISNK